MDYVPLYSFCRNWVRSVKTFYHGCGLWESWDSEGVKIYRGSVSCCIVAKCFLKELLQADLMPATKAPGSAAIPHRHTAEAGLQVPAARAAYMPAAYCYCNQDCSIPEIWYRILASNRTRKSCRAFCLGEEEERYLNDGSKFFTPWLCRKKA